MTRKILVLLSWFQKHKITVSLIIISCITNLSLTIFNGRRICVDSGCGLYIGGLHFHDSLWHLALSNVAFQQYPFILPIFSGVNLSSYNYLSSKRAWYSDTCFIFQIDTSYILFYVCRFEL